jgi:hypothetical protein
MPFASYETSQVLGIGNYVGEIRQGPDGQLYEWVEGVDGLGNDIGFFKKLVGKVAGKALNLFPGANLVKGAVKGFCQGLPKLAPCAEQSVELKPVFQVGTKLCSILGKVGLAEVEDGIMQAPDGQLYEVVEGIGESGQVKQYLRPVWMSIPVVIRPRRRQGMRRGVQAQPGTAAPRPAAQAQAGAPVRRFR